MSNLRYLVFVYGTLKTGEPCHDLLNDPRGKCTRRGEAVTAEKFPLVIATKYNGPFLLFEPGMGHRVHGEVYEVDDEMLKLIDKLEYHPVVYERIETTVVLTKTKADTSGTTKGDNGMDILCWTYFIVKYMPQLLKLPMLDQYTANIDGKTFERPSDPASVSACLSEIHKDYQ